MSSRRVAVMAFDGINPFHLSLPGIVFGGHLSASGEPLYEYSVCTAERRRLRTTAGYSIEVGVGLEGVREADVVIVPSWRDPMEQAPAAMVKALRAACDRGALVVSLCLGAFVLGDTGLLDGRRATTHWRWAEVFARRFPQVDLQPDSLYVEDGNLLSSAGNAAGIDCCLHIFRTHHGAEAANQLARRLVISPHRQGGQAQFIERPMQLDGSGDRMSRTIVWAQRHLELPHTIQSLSDRASMSPRTFARRFQQLTGTSVKRWLTDQRLSVAQRLLETSDASIEVIAESVGFADSLSLRQHFSSKLQTTPSLYRREFRSATLNRP